VPSEVLEIARQFKDEFDIAVMINGQLQPTHSHLSADYKFTAHPAYGPLNYDDGFLSASAAVSGGGFTLDVRHSVRRPLLLIHGAEGEDVWTSTLNQIMLAEHASLQLAEIFVGENGKYLRSDITRVILQDGAQLEWARVQQENEQASSFGEVQAHLMARSRLAVTQVNSGAEWSRGSLKIDIQGEGAEALINGLSFGRAQQHIDQRVQVSHHAANTISHQLFKGVLKDRARGVLNGKIYIARDAQKVVSSQLNHNLLLGSGAEADTKPELEIYADDVKANHGASVGRLDEEKLFDFLSRGIPREVAERMLAQAFVADVMMKIPSAALRALVRTRVDGLLPGFLL
jgi:Fe-S cluster assembly protein SufD